jgi:uroporphyrinogen decarboxylase
MSPREYVERAIARQRAPGSAFWVGHPSDEAKKLYFERAGLAGHEASRDEARNAESSVLLTSPPGARKSTSTGRSAAT